MRRSLLLTVKLLGRLMLSLAAFRADISAAELSAPRKAGDAAARAGAADEAVVPWLLYESKQTRVGLLAHEVFRRAELISRATARALWHYVAPLTHDARGRRTLVANAAAHAALFALLLALVQMIYAG